MQPETNNNNSDNESNNSNNKVITTATKCSKNSTLFHLSKLGCCGSGLGLGLLGCCCFCLFFFFFWEQARLPNVDKLRPGSIRIIHFCQTHKNCWVTFVCVSRLPAMPVAVVVLAVSQWFRVTAAIFFFSTTPHTQSHIPSTPTRPSISFCFLFPFRSQHSFSLNFCCSCRAVRVLSVLCPNERKLVSFVAKI